MQWAQARRAVFLGVALAVVTRFHHYLPGDSDWVRKVGVPWLAIGFAAAIGEPRGTRGALLGALSLVVAILAYYAILAFVQGAYAQSPIGIGWLVVAVPGGAVFGALGSRWSQGRDRVPIAALMAACFAGEAVLFRRFIDPAATPYLLAMAAAMPPLLLARARDRLRAAALALPLVGVAVFAEAYVLVATGYMASQIA
jgi:Family of unknown function (DUF6518)